MRLAACLLAVAVASGPALPAGAQSGTSSTGSSSTADSSRTTARGQLLLPLAGGANTALGYSFNRQSRLVQHDMTSRGLARAIEGDLAAQREAQDAYYAKHQTYATSIEELKGMRVTSGETIVLRDVTALGWTAEATHPSLPGSSFVGQVARAESVWSPAGP